MIKNWHHFAGARVRLRSRRSRRFFVQSNLVCNKTSLGDTQVVPTCRLQLAYLLITQVIINNFVILHTSNNYYSLCLFKGRINNAFVVPPVLQMSTGGGQPRLFAATIKKGCMCLDTFVTPSRRYYCTDLAEFCNEDKLYYIIL